jgi:hypothetical protein
MRQNIVVLLCIAPLIASCGTRSSASVSPVLGATADVPKAVAVTPKPLKDILITADDITNRHYRAVGDISVTVSKWTLFDADPTPAKVNDALQEKAASLGADAVVLVRYGTAGMSLFSWGSLDGSGRAVVFEN